MVVPVLMTSCQVSLNPNSGPVMPQTTIDQRGQHEGGRPAGRVRGPLGEARERRRGLGRSQCVIAWSSTSMPSAYPAGENW